MPANPHLLQTLITIMKEDTAPAYMLNKSFDIFAWAQKLFQDIENKRSSVTAITREQATQLNKNNLQFSTTKHESRINAFYRLLGLPSELAVQDSKFNLLDSNGKNITTNDALVKTLLQREYQELLITIKQFLNTNTLEELNVQLNSEQAAEKQLIAELYDPNIPQLNRLFPMVQYSQIQNVVEATNKIAPAFASAEERYINGSMKSPPFLETIITIRLLPQSGGAKINTQGVVEDLILKSLGFALAELAKQYHNNQAEAEKLLMDGITTIRNKVNGVNSSAVKAPSLNANQREQDDDMTKEQDIRSKYTQTQINLYADAISLLPLDNDVIPTGVQIGNIPFATRNIKENALTSSFINILNANLDALQRSVKDTKKVLQKRQLTQDKLTADLGSIIGNIGGISLAEIVIVIAALFVLDEEDLVGLLSKSRFDQLIASSSNTTTSTDSSSNNQKTINIFDILNQFKDTVTPTATAVKNFQDVVKAIYTEFRNELAAAHIV